MNSAAMESICNRLRAATLSIDEGRRLVDLIRARIQRDDDSRKVILVTSLATTIGSIEIGPASREIEAEWLKPGRFVIAEDVGVKINGQPIERIASATLRIEPDRPIEFDVKLIA